MSELAFYLVGQYGVRSPFPYFGGSRDCAPLVWRALGDVQNYVEPCFGSGAVLLARPHEPNRTRTEESILTRQLIQPRPTFAAGSTLPRHFCWTRFGTEAGETIEQILERKEQERRANDGIFLWGIGNAIAPSMRELVRRESSPEVIFSPIKSPSKPEDVRPATTVMWRSARDLAGSEAPLPKGSKVISRGPSGSRPAKHYALVCRSDAPLLLETCTAEISFGALENLLTSNPVGASQVTAVVQYRQDMLPLGRRYAVAMRTRLVEPFLLELTDPEPVQPFGGEPAEPHPRKEGARRPARTAA